MLSEKQIFDMSQEELENKIKKFNQVHINIKMREQGEDFSYYDYGGKKEYIVNDAELNEIIENLIPGLANNINSKMFYNLVEPILGHIIHRNLGKIINGYEIEEMGVQTSIPLSVHFIVNKYSAKENALVPHSKEVEDITYSELEEKILDSMTNIKYMLNRGQCGIRENISFDSNEIQAVKTKYNFYELNREIKAENNTINKKIKL